jgi:hypothetical protein
VHKRIVVAIPAKDEAEEIGPCLQALAAQEGAMVDGVVLCINNSSDDSGRIVRGMAGRLPFAVHPLEIWLPPECACAGMARRIAMDRAAELAGTGGIVLTTDADARVAPDWVAANLRALSEGADAVAGRAEIEPAGAKLIPAHLHAIDARECAYAALLDEICSLLDPDPADPWPRHDEHSGASITVTVAAYRRAGGIPPVKLAEDRAFFLALRRVDARIRHSMAARVVVSARLIGRAPGGMADTMRERIARVHEFVDDRLEPALDAVRRSRLRRRSFCAWQAQLVSPGLAMRLGLPVAEVEGVMAALHFGTAWAELEARSPVLQRRRVPLADLARQTARALRLRDGLRTSAVTRAADRAGTALPAAAE